MVAGYMQHASGIDEICIKGLNFKGERSKTIIPVQHLNIYRKLFTKVTLNKTFPETDAYAAGFRIMFCLFRVC